jgi:tetratricopeptide (TPR) repeat protein
VILPLLLAGLVAAPPSVAVGVMPPTTDQPESAYLGLVFADELEASLLGHVALDAATSSEMYPLSVFGWRQTLAAAREVDVTPDRLLTSREGREVAGALGAAAVFTASYWVKSSSVRVAWRLVGVAEYPRHDLELPLEDAGSRIRQIHGVLTTDLGIEDDTSGLGATPPKRPFASLRPYGEALGILQRQSLDPRARIALSTDDLNRAHQLLGESIRLAPAFGRAWVWKAIVSSMLGDSNRAFGELQSARGAGEVETPAEALGIFYAYQKAGQSETAIRRLGSTLNHHHGFLLGLGYLGQAYLQMGKPSEAMQLFTIYADRVPASPWVATMKGECLGLLGRDSEAIGLLMAARRRWPDSELVLVALATRQIESGRHEDGRRTLMAALKADEANPGLLARLAQLELDDGRVANAVGLSDRAIAEAIDQADDYRGDPAASFPYLVQARVLAHVGNKEKAINALTQAADLGVSPDQLERLRRDPLVAELLRDPRLAVLTRR